jgi:hypothetical protein
MYISSGVGLQLAPSYDTPEEEWGEILDFQSIVSEDTILQPATWSEESDSFMAAAYGYDGRTIESYYYELNDTANANRNDSDAYYVVGSFYARSDVGVNVSLGEAVEIDDGEHAAGTYVIGSPEWDTETLTHEDGGSGAETAIRLGFRITPVDWDTGAVLGNSTFYIYEPNCDSHIDENITGYVETPSIDGGEELIDSAYLIRQETSTWSEAYPVQREVTIKNLGKFLTDTELFTLYEGEMVKIDLYVWLEGQDVDCTNLIDAAKIIASVDFATEYSGQTGMETIPTN